DEPSSGLDPKAGRELTELLAALRDEGKAILMSTHDVFRAKQVADRVGILRAGRLVAERERAQLDGVDLETLYVRAMEDALESVDSLATDAVEDAMASPGGEEVASCSV
ncbi:MAG: hypothetical protein AAGE94_10440, partial [Acidobacteriota bacterium]